MVARPEFAWCLLVLHLHAHLPIRSENNKACLPQGRCMAILEGRAMVCQQEWDVAARVQRGGQTRGGIYRRGTECRKEIRRSPSRSKE